jgi:hypothetical protein
MNGGQINIDNVTPAAGAAEAKNDDIVVAEKVETPKELPTTSGKALISWSAHNFEHHDKGFVWYLLAVLIILVVGAYFGWQRDWISVGIIVFLSGVFFWYAAAVKPKIINYAITNFGIQADNHFYDYAQIHSFALVYSETVQNLYITFNKKYLPVLAINITDVDPMRIRQVLGRKLPEREGASETLVDKLVRFTRI